MGRNFIEGGIGELTFMIYISVCLEEKLDDSDTSMPIPPFSPYCCNYSLSITLGVVAATVNVLCELVRRDPKEYLTLAPRLFHLLTTSSNNWMLIKIIKIVRLIKQSFTPMISPCSVWFAFSKWTTASQETPITYHWTYFNHPGNITPVWMCTHVHHRGDVAGSQWRLSG